MKETDLMQLLERHYQAAVKSVQSDAWLIKVDDIELKIIELFNAREV